MTVDFHLFIVPRYGCRIFHLEEKVSALANLCLQLRQDNNVLRQQVAGLESQNQALQLKLDKTADQIEALLARMPEDEL